MRFCKAIFLFSFLFQVVSAFSQRNSWDGWVIPPRGEIRVLNFFVNIIYDLHPENEKQFARQNSWNTVYTESLNEGKPNYLRALMDCEYDKQNLYGSITRLFGESSFDELRFVGDFVVVNIKESRVLQLGSFNQRNIEIAAVRFINEQGGLQTIFGHNDIDYYDYKRLGQIGFVQFFFRNITKKYGGDDVGSGYFTTSILRNEKLLVGGKYYGFSGLGTAQAVGTIDVSLNPTGVVQHELAHPFFGPNSFHTSGGNHRRSGEYMPFLPLQGGFGLMGGYSSSLVSCNGYERWRLRWRHKSNENENDWWIVAKNLSGETVNADISRDDGRQTFILRDFLTFGDAVRIKLPYKSSESVGNQYIWLENHQVGKNGKLEFLQFANEVECRPKNVAGVYAYYQVGRDVLTGNESEVFSYNDRDNLRVIPAEGYWNYEYKKADTVYKIRCVNWNNHDYYCERTSPNPFCGAHDQERLFFPDDESNVLSLKDEKVMWRKVVDNQNVDSLVIYGDSRDMFCTSTRLNMATNPSTCNTLTYYNSLTESKFEYKQQSRRNERTVFLSGLGIIITPLEDGNFRVDVCWDDYEIANDAVWSGKIRLVEKAILHEKCVIDLEPSLTVNLPERDTVTGLFADATELSCAAGSEFVQKAKSSVNLRSNSTLVLESGSVYKLEKNAKLRIDKTSRLVLGGDLILNKGAKLTIKSKEGIVDVGGRILYDKEER